MIRLDAFASLVFDCDGVLLDSNRVKTEAFRDTALCWFDAATADAFVDYHVRHGGISRYEKFAWLLAQTGGVRPDGPGVQDLLDEFSRRVRLGLQTCEASPDLHVLRQATRHARWHVVSGGDQAELREVFAARGLAGLFDGGIFGSPDDKPAILGREIAGGNIARTALFLGDSRYDHVCATQAGLEFAFVSGWSEFTGWPAYCREHGLAVVSSLGDLLKAC